MDPASLSAFNLLLIFAYVFGIYVAANCFRREVGGSRFRGLALLPLAGGSLMVIALAVVYPDQTRDMLERLFEGDLFLGRVGVAWSWLAAIATIFAAAVAGEIAIVHFQRHAAFFIESVGRRVSRRPLNLRYVSDILLVGALGLSIAGVFVVGDRLRSMVSELTPEADESSVSATYLLDGLPTDVVMTGPDSGYVAILQGSIMRFELPSEPEGALIAEVATEEVVRPLGLAILGNTLFVADAGQLPCENPIPSCPGRIASTDSEADGQLDILESSNGKVVAFDILPDAMLANRRVVLSELPVFGSEHAVNGLAAGPDGRVYLSIGNTRFVAASDLDRLAELDRPNLDLLGTVVSFRPDGSELEVFAQGTRNIFDLTFDERGRLYGADNDGPALRGWYLESVLQIKRGAHYGFPFEGTLSEAKVRTDQPLWILPNVGSAGIEWAGRAGLDPGLLIGGLNRLMYLPLSEDEDGVFVSGRGLVETILQTRGYVTGLAARSSGGVVAAVFDLPAGGRLLVLEFEE